jgi:hypothetical protein
MEVYMKKIMKLMLIGLLVSMGTQELSFAMDTVTSPMGGGTVAGKKKRGRKHKTTVASHDESSSDKDKPVAAPFSAPSLTKEQHLIMLLESDEAFDVTAFSNAIKPFGFETKRALTADQNAILQKCYNYLKGKLAKFSATLQEDTLLTHETRVQNMEKKANFLNSLFADKKSAAKWYNTSWGRAGLVVGALGILYLAYDALGFDGETGIQIHHHAYDAARSLYHSGCEAGSRAYNWLTSHSPSLGGSHRAAPSTITWETRKSVVNETAIAEAAQDQLASISASFQEQTTAALEHTARLAAEEAARQAWYNGQVTQNATRISTEAATAAQDRLADMSALFQQQTDAALEVTRLATEKTARLAAEQLARLATETAAPLSKTFVEAAQDITTAATTVVTDAFAQTFTDLSGRVKSISEVAVSKVFQINAANLDAVKELITNAGLEITKIQQATTRGFFGGTPFVTITLK